MGWAVGPDRAVDRFGSRSRPEAGQDIHLLWTQSRLSYGIPSSENDLAAGESRLSGSTSRKLFASPSDNIPLHRHHHFLKRLIPHRLHATIPDDPHRHARIP